APPGPPPSVVPREAAPGLDEGAVLLRLDHPRLLAAALLARPPPHLLLLLARGRRGRPCARLEPLAEPTPRPLAVRGLRALGLAPHLDARGPVAKPHRRGGGVDILAAGPAPADEAL